MDLTVIGDLEDKIDRLHAERDELAANLREQKETASCICEASDRQTESGACRYTRKGRGDCYRYLGIPKGHTEEDGKPRGWCWYCWLRFLKEEYEVALRRVNLAYSEAERQRDECLAKANDDFLDYQADIAKLEAENKWLAAELRRGGGKC